MFIRITEDFKNSEFPEEFGNSLFYSDVEEGSGEEYEYRSNLSIKYVEEGVEYYVLNGKRIKVGSGFYLIVNNGSQVICERTKITKDKGISIFLDSDVLSEVLYFYSNKTKGLLNNPESEHLPVNFFEDLFFSKDNLLGKVLSKVVREQTLGIDRSKESDEFYFHIADALVNTHLSNLKTISEIRNEKKSTREEIYRRVNRGKVAIESSLFKNISIDEIAKESTLSKYHFIRSFSEINGVSPYKYLLQRRVEEAKKMIEKGDQSISDIALEVGFSDVSAFSKRFKAEVGVSPSKIISNHQ